MHFTIVSYTFPPSTEIGGRRWAKFSQQLSRRGHAVTVVCANDPVDPGWFKKEFSGVDVRVLPKNYPQWLTGFTRSMKEKLLYLIYTRFLSHFTKQNFFDRGYAWKKPMLNELEKIHRENRIDTLIVTGGPFSLLYYGSLFKLKHMGVQYVADLRDPWTWGNLYGIPRLPTFKKKYQETSQYQTIKVCDMVCYPTQNMGDFLEKKYPSFKSKLYLLPHAYDPDKFTPASGVEKRSGFIYGGTLYDGIESYIRKLIQIVKANPGTGFTWHVYTGSHYPLIESDTAKEFIYRHSFVPEQELFEKIRNSSGYLALFPETDKDLISTKFYEIIYTNTPILYIGEEGDVGRFIRDNRLGVHILPENMERDLPKYLNGNIPFEPGYFDVLKYTFSSVTEQFLMELKQNKK